MTEIGMGRMEGVEERGRLKVEVKEGEEKEDEGKKVERIGRIGELGAKGMDNLRLRYCLKQSLTEINW